MHNNSKSVHNQSRIPRQPKPIYIYIYLRCHDDVISILHQNTTWLFFGEWKKKSTKILCIFRQKHLGFHPQTLILQSKPKICIKKCIIGRTKISPNFRNSIGWALKNHKKWWVLLQTIFSTSLQHQSSLKTEKQHQTKEKKLQKNGFRNQKTENLK